MVELRLEPALEITLFLFIGERGGTCLIEDPAGPGDIFLFEKQLDRAQLRAIVPLLVAEQLRINPERFLRTLQSPERFGTAEHRRGSERRTTLRRNFLVKNESLRP